MFLSPSVNCLSAAVALLGLLATKGKGSSRVPCIGHRFCFPYVRFSKNRPSKALTVQGGCYTGKSRASLSLFYGCVCVGQAGDYRKAKKKEPQGSLVGDYKNGSGLRFFLF